ncbi:BQ2448_5761 [Microbotryum intermedium]|uniref:Large ribosomal subunit protein mL44 n=1 Tax=Microbotryum intermedium TaxID=269621 RepID=A0A238F281_9BASI|nr:BQ2448_5761 [Microbotryum intermedium]
MTESETYRAPHDQLPNAVEQRVHQVLLPMLQRLTRSDPSKLAIFQCGFFQDLRCCGMRAQAVGANERGHLAEGMVSLLDRLSLTGSELLQGSVSYADGQRFEIGRLPYKRWINTVLYYLDRSLKGCFGPVLAILLAVDARCTAAICSKAWVIRAMSRSALHSVRTWSTIATMTATQVTTCTSRHCDVASSASASSIELGRRPGNKIAEPRLQGLPPQPPNTRSFSSASTSAAAAATAASTSHASSRAYISPRSHVPREVRRTSNSNRKLPSSASGLDVEPSNTQTAFDPTTPTPSPTPTPSETTELDSYTPSPLTDQSLSLLFTYTTPPALSSLSAFAGRLASSVVGAGKDAAQFSLAADLSLLEQCLIHESFWMGVNALPKSSAAERRHTHFHDSPISVSARASVTVLRAHNEPLASLGNALLGSFTAEALIEQFPNLPTRVTKAALTMFVGPKSLAAVATSWGVAPTRLDQRWVGRPDVAKLSRKDRAYGHLIGGVGPAAKRESVGGDGAAGIGLVRWNRTQVSPVKDVVLFEDALASVARAVVGAIYQTHGFNAARKFAHAHFLASLIPSTSSKFPSPIASSQIVPLLRFTNPTSVLSSHLVSKASGDRATHRLLKESGRLSNHATFVSGVYSGTTKLGEGFGSSIKMSEYRASEDALRRLYLGGKGAKGTQIVGSRVWDERGRAVHG